MHLSCLAVLSRGKRSNRTVARGWAPISEAAQPLCWSACRAEDEHRPERFNQAMLAKYFSSRAAVRAATDAIQIHGAAGCHESSPVARFFRSSKIMEIIEGTTQVHERLLADGFVREAAGRLPRT